MVLYVSQGYASRSTGVRERSGEGRRRNGKGRGGAGRGRHRLLSRGDSDGGVGAAGVETEDDASRVTNTEGNTTGVAKNGSGREEGARGAEDTQR